MDFTKIKKLVQQKESDTVEFKTSTTQLKATFETVCAFLNGQGGVVLTGINDKGQVVGHDVSDNTRLEIARELNKIEPTPHINTHYISIKKNKFVIAIQVDSGKHAPYIYDGRPFQRNQSATIRMSQHRYEQLLVERGQQNHSWEEVYINDCSLEDLDHDLILRAVRFAIQERRLNESVILAKPKEILEKFNLIQGGRLTRAAVLLFCKNEKKQFIQSQLRLARFKGTNKQEFIDNKLLIDNAFQIYEKAINFLSNHLPIAGKISDDSPYRIDTPAIPYKALRETLVNAICHRDYSIRGGAISIAIYDDRVEITNTGNLPTGISSEDLYNTHRSVLRNPLIAKVLHTCGFIEMWGRGTQEIIEFCKQSGKPEPKFLSTNIDFTVCFPLFETNTTMETIKQPQQLSLNPRQEEILRLLHNHHLMTTKEILHTLQNPPSLRTVKADLFTLHKLGLIQQQEKGKNTRWKIKI